jgi:glycosyltransferase involved in cell wall biosynthesis
MPVPPSSSDRNHPAGDARSPAVEVSVIAPAHNERDNVMPLVESIHAALEPAQLSFEIVIVDDGSTDGTDIVLRELLGTYARLRVIRMRHTPHGRGLGQSAAFKAGIGAARGRLIAMLDADLQNDPADLPRMLELMRQSGADMVQGDRSRARRDGLLRQVSSIVGRAFRRWLLGDTIRDTGCSLRLMRRAIAEALPLEYRGMHRFIPITARQLGYVVVEMPVSHRPRTAGATSYGIWNRALPSLIDCFAVRWMRSRRRPIASDVVIAEHVAEIETTTAARSHTETAVSTMRAGS